MSPSRPEKLLLLLVVLGALLIVVQVGIITIAFHKLGLSAQSAYVLLLGSLLGSAVNVPLFWTRNRPRPEARAWLVTGLWPIDRPGRTLVAINVGGAVVPLLFSLYLVTGKSLDLSVVALSIAMVAVLCYLMSQPVAGVGVVMPVFVAPLIAALVGITFGGEESAALAYVSGTLGVLVGADLVRLPSVGKLGAPMAAIGGAGTFDAIFLTGVVAVLIA